ncbi:MAG TPA: hypothetical protein VGD68_13665 [Streptosporangiaceae bacterium]
MNTLSQSLAHRRKSLFVSAGIAAAVLVGTGGALAGSALAGSPQSGGSSSATAATLNAAVSSTATSAATTPAAKAHRAAAFTRLRRLGGMYGQASFRGKDGTTRTLAYERGTVVSAGGDLVVKAANGTTLAWQYVSDTAVREGGKKVSRSDLSSGERVLVAGPVVSGNRDARVVIVAGARHSGSSTAPAPAPSSSASTSSS